MATTILKHRKSKKGLKVSQDYDAAADAKNRISLRGAKTKYFHVKPLPNGGYLLEPRVLVAPAGVPKRKANPVARSAKVRSCYAAAKDLIGSIKGLPKDIATNPKYMEGFGE